MKLTFFFLLSICFLSAELFQPVHPESPGVYHVTVFENGTREFVKVERHERVKASNHPGVWDFRTVTNSRTITNVFDQGNCGGCWAFSSADVAGASLYLNTNGATNTILSPQYMIDCHAIRNFGRYTYEQGGCNGGYPLVAFADIQDNGLPTQQCIPWVRTERKTCPTKCSDGSALNKVTGTFHYVDAYKVSLETLRDLVTTSGPCIAEMKAYDDLSNYKANGAGVFPIYSHPTDSDDYEGHAVTVYGFGKEGSTNYWLIKNSWGSSWGMGGFFKIKMGTNDSGIENNFYSLYDNDFDYSTSLVPPPSGGGTAVTDGTECVKQTTPTACTTAGCQWFPQDTAHPICDTPNPTCEEFAAEYCNDTWRWGLDCVPGGKYVCTDRDRSVSHCAGLSDSVCQSTTNCRLYTNGDTKTCDMLGAKCAWFNETNCGSTESANLELKCILNTTTNECQSQSIICRPLGRMECSMPVGSASVCHWYDGGSSGIGFCDVNEARCSWFSADTCVVDSEMYDSMKCEVIDGQCSFGTQVAVRPLLALLLLLLLALFV